MQHHFFTLRNGALEPTPGSVVQEFPIQLMVNGRELATLIASPHDLRFLVAGFLRLQGFVKTTEDILMLGVCEEFGTASIQIKGELPEKLKPVLTSGCGTGISFSMPDISATETGTSGNAKIHPEHIFSLMEQLAGQAEKYRSSGGIHSAAAGREGELLLYAEDLGRHNTLDRIAGEALLRGVDLQGTTLVTSGRVSTEMVAKSLLLGVRTIASRTSPTNMAVELCNRNGICLVGYVRGNKFTVYSHPEMIDATIGGNRISGVTGIILAGGASTRMGSNKALLKIDGMTMVERAYRILSSLFDEILLITNTPDEYPSIPCRKIPDIHQGYGSIAGLHSALSAAETDRIFVAACDMPFLKPELIRLLCRTAPAANAVVPSNPAGLREPLHAVYSKAALPAVAKMIGEGEKSILKLLDRIGTTELLPAAYAFIENAEASFGNINTPGEFQALQGSNRTSAPGEGIS